MERGIDSITIAINQKSWSKSGHDQQSATISQLFQSTEHLVRALSNLHERLHHSVNLYLLPSSTKFVSHGEYLYPCVLILLPFVIRAVSLLFIHIDYFHYRSVTPCILVMALLSWIVYHIMPYLNGTIQNVDQRSIFLIIVYLILFVSWRRIILHSGDLNDAWNDIRQSLQFIACLFVIYTHAPLVLSHVALAYPSAVYWCILLGFPRYITRDEELFVFRIFKGVLAVSLILITWPPTFIVPYVFEDYTVYVCLVYMPLHFLFTLLIYQGCFPVTKNKINSS